MPSYVIWVCDSSWNKETALVNQGTYGDWVSLDYRLRVSGTDSAQIKLAPNSIKLPYIEVMKRLLIYRDGELEFGGIILGKSWDERIRPADQEYIIDALGGAILLDWRTIPPATASAYDERTDNADDLAKAYVTAHASASATVVARRFTDLTVQANAGACSSWTEQPRWDMLLEEVTKLGQLGGFDWRVVPSGAGFEFQTEYPDWGLDRTWGNGVNEDAVFTVDRRNFEWIKYVIDVIDHRNHIYVLGQGEGADQVVREREAGEDVAGYMRREKVISATAYEDSTALDYIGDMELRACAPIEGLTVKPLSTTYKKPWGLGDLVTIQVSRYGSTYRTDAKIKSVQVVVGQDNIEQITPEIEAISNQVSNPKFEEAGDGTVFEDWEDASTTPYADETTTIFRDSLHSCKLVRGALGTCIAEQAARPITASRLYRMDVWSYGDGSHAAYMETEDNTGTKVTTALPTAAAWSHTTHHIRMSSTATTADLRVGITGAVGGYVFIGLVWFRRV